MMAELLALVHIGDMYLYARAFHAADAILQGNAGVGVGTRIEHYAIVGEAYFLQLVDKLALDVALIVFYFYLWKPLSERCKAVFHRLLSIDAGFARSQEVEVGAVDDDDSHDSFVE